MAMRTLGAGTAMVAAVLLSACATAPEYRKPALDMPVAWKVEAPWREGTPNDGAPKGPWWQGFGDPQLDLLEQQALAGSPTLALASARLAQARAHPDLRIEAGRCRGEHCARLRQRIS